MSEQYPQDLLDLGYSQEIIDEYDNDLLRTLDGLMPWEVPGAEYQGYGNPYASWWGGGDIPMDDPRRAEAARALYEKTGKVYTPFDESQPTLAKNIQATVDRINKQGQFRFGDDWETYYFDPTKFLDVPITGSRGQADYSQFKSALTQDIQDYYQQYDPESLNWRDEAIGDIKIDMYQNRGQTYADYEADQQRDEAARQATIDEAARLGITVNELRRRRKEASIAKRNEREARRAEQEAYRNSPQYEIDRQREQNDRIRALFGIGPAPETQVKTAPPTAEAGLFDPNITWFVDGQEIDPASRSMTHFNPAFQGQNLRRDVYSNMYKNITGYGSDGEQVPMLDWLQNYANQNNIPINIAELNPQNPNDREVLNAWSKLQSQQRTSRYRQAMQEKDEKLAAAGIPEFVRAGQAFQYNGMFSGAPQTNNVTPEAQPNTMFGQTPASTSVTQNNLLNDLTNKIKSQRAAVLKNLFGM